MCGGFVGMEKLSIRLCAYSTEKSISRANSPLYSG